MGITVLTAGLFLPLVPALAITFNTLRIETNNETFVTTPELYITSCREHEGGNEPQLLTFWNGQGIGSGWLVCEVGKVIINTEGYYFDNGRLYDGIFSVENEYGTVSVEVVPPIINFPNNFIASILAYAGRFFSDLNPLVLVWIGLAVGFFIIQYIIDLIVTRSRKNK